MKAAYFTDRNRFLVAVSKPIYALGHALQKLAFWIRCKRSTDEDTITFADRRYEEWFEPGMMVVVSTDTGEEPDYIFRPGMMEEPDRSLN